MTPKDIAYIFAKVRKFRSDIKNIDETVFEAFDYESKIDDKTFIEK